MTARSTPLWLIAPLLGIASLALTAASGGLSHGFADPDEAAHYVNCLFLGDWLRAGLPAPMTYARDFYAHFPKLSIGHWPPGWYALLSPLFAVARPSPFGAAMLAAFVAGLPAVLVCWALRRAGHAGAGVLAAFAMLLLPLVMDDARNFMLDEPTALAAGAAAIAWLAVAERPGAGRYLLFALLAAFAPLVKGNGALIMLVPPIEIALAGRWRLLRDVRLWLAGAVTLLLVAPWYYVSFRISAGGFNYAPGAAYALASLGTDARAMLASIGWPGLALAAIGVVSNWRAPVARLALAVILATLIFQAGIPAALGDRYILPLLPWLVALAALGALALLRRRGWWTGLAALLVAGAAQPAVSALLARAPKADAGVQPIADRMARAPGIWLVDGKAGSEGAVIAAGAWADAGRRDIWIARASQWLSTSDFMGRDYALSVHSPAKAGAVLDRLGVRGAVSVVDWRGLAYPHSAYLRAALRPPGYALSPSRFVVAPGSVLTAIRAAPIRPRPDLLAAGIPSHDVAAMTGALR